MLTISRGVSSSYSVGSVHDRLIWHSVGGVGVGGLGGSTGGGGSCTGTLGKCTKQFSDPKSIFQTELKLTQGKIAAMISTDNTNVNVVPVLGKKEKQF